MQPGLAQHSDVDNAIGIVEFHSGQIAYYYCSRMMAHGQEDVTEVIGTLGKVSVNLNPQDSLVNLYHEGGVTRGVPRDYYGRFEGAFVREANEFTRACLEGGEVRGASELRNAVTAVQIGAWLQEAMRTGRQICFDEEGRRVERAGL